MSLYALLLFGSISLPLLLSFDKKLQFYKGWKNLFPSIMLVAVVYLSFDCWLTSKGVWGFNADYHSSYGWLGLPVEEWLFFIIIPYASIFLHDSIVTNFQHLSLNNDYTRLITFILIGLFVILIAFNTDKTYTVYIFIKMILVLLWSAFDLSGILNRFYITFLVIIIPFTIVNGILTGSLIEDQVVWYNDNENLGIRFFTIPIEDFVYAFSLIAFALLLREQWIKILNKRGIHHETSM